MWTCLRHSLFKTGFSLNWVFLINWRNLVSGSVGSQQRVGGDKLTVVWPQISRGSTHFLGSALRQQRIHRHNQHIGATPKHCLDCGYISLAISGLELSMVGTFSLSEPTIDPPLPSQGHTQTMRNNLHWLWTPRPPSKVSVGPNFSHHKARVQAVGWFPLGTRKLGSRLFAAPTPPPNRNGAGPKGDPRPQHALAPSLQAGTW